MTNFARNQFAKFYIFIEQMQSIYLLAALCAAIITVVLSFCFLFINVPDIPTLSAYRKSRFLLGTAYLVLGIGNIFVLIAFYKQIEIDRNLLFPLVAVISSLQAFLFSSTLNCLLDPQYFRRNYILIPLIVIALYIIVSCLQGVIYPIFWWANILFYLYYLSQLFFYTFRYIKNERHFRKKLGDLYSDDSEKRINWLRFSFFSALTIGIFAATILLAINFTSLSILISVYSLFYIWFAIHFFNYPVFFSKLKDCFVTEPGPEMNTSIPFFELDNVVEKWIVGKGFLQPDITLNQLALDFCTNRTYLSSYINTNMKVNFNGWINSLRIEEAVKLMQKHPDWSIAQVGDETGFADSACFCRHFKRIKGVTPRTYRENTRFARETNCGEKGY